MSTISLIATTKRDIVFGFLVKIVFTPKGTSHIFSKSNDIQRSFVVKFAVSLTRIHRKVYEFSQKPKILEFMKRESGWFQQLAMEHS